MPADWDREFVPVSRQVANSVDGGRGTMRHNALICCSLPRGHLWCQLKPGGPEIPMIRRRSSGDLVNAVCDPLKPPTRLGQALHRCRADACVLDLAARDEAPLVLSQFLEAR